MNYVQLNEFVTIDAEIFKCIESVSTIDRCSYCDFQDYSGKCDCHECTDIDRKDTKSVIFILYDNVLEDCNARL